MLQCHAECHVGGRQVFFPLQGTAFQLATPSTWLDHALWQPRRIDEELPGLVGIEPFSTSLLRPLSISTKVSNFHYVPFFAQVGGWSSLQSVLRARFSTCPNGRALNLFWS
jgi:hypothetical protein